MAVDENLKIELGKQEKSLVTTNPGNSTTGALAKLDLADAVRVGLLRD